MWASLGGMKIVQLCSTPPHRGGGMHSLPCFETPAHYTAGIIRWLKNQMPRALQPLGQDYLM